MSRAIGDADCSSWLIAEPHVRTVALPPGGCDIVLATDGVWDAQTDAAVVATARAAGTLQSAAERIRRAPPAATRPPRPPPAARPPLLPLTPICFPLFSAKSMRRGEGPRDDVTVIVLRVAPEGTAAARRAAGIGERRPRASPRKAMSGMSLLSRGRRSLSFNNSSPPSSNGSDDGLPLPPPTIPAALSVPRGSSLDRSGYSETSDAPTISADSPVLKAYDSEDRSTDASVKGGTLCLDALAEEAKALADEVNAALQTSAAHLETAPTSSATTSAPTSGAASAGHSPNLSRTYEVTPPLEVTSPARLATPPPLLAAA